MTKNRERHQTKRAREAEVGSVQSACVCYICTALSTPKHRHEGRCREKQGNRPAAENSRSSRKMKAGYKHRAPKIQGKM